MRRHLSVLYVSARATIYRVLLLLGLMAVAEGGLFYALRGKWQDTLPFSKAVSASGVPIVCAICFALLCAMLLLTNVLGSKAKYTLWRLSVPESAFVLWQGVYNSFCLLAFWATQVLLLLGMNRVYFASIDPALLGTQSQLIALYTGTFSHAFLPLADVATLVRNVLFVVGVGMAMAGDSHHLRRGSLPGFGLIALVLAAVLFPQTVWQVSRGEVMVGIVLALAAASVYTSLVKGGMENEA
jgi:hypothetical protein